jgi:hypothetical protein
MLQGVREPVASFNRWKSLGRHVVRGARAKEVIVPVLVHGPEISGPSAEDETLQEKRERVARLIGFKLVRGVFALSDTEGKDLPPAPVPGWDLQKALDKLGIREVPFEGMNGNVQGYSRGLEFAINPVAVDRRKTVAHELGHIVLGHTTHYDLDMHRGMREFEAEATAYLFMNEVGLLDEETAAHSRGYVQHWLDGERPDDKSIQRVFRATEAILRAGRTALTEPSEQ